ncbi:MAG: hypothetical protein O7E52_15475 [Candidatus Poribacteria bacterium]|nr:hypothetical protein [Candidatus Poribacteria bacterium]
MQALREVTEGKLVPPVAPVPPVPSFEVSFEVSFEELAPNFEGELRGLP